MKFRWPLPTLLFGVMVAVFLFAPLGWWLKSRLEDRRFEQLTRGVGDYSVSRFAIRGPVDKIVICTDPGVCSYLTGQMRESKISRDEYVDTGVSSMHSAEVTLELAEGGRNRSVGDIGRNGMLLSMPPNNIAGWDHFYTHFIRFDDDAPRRLNEIVLFLTNDERNGETLIVGMESD